MQNIAAQSYPDLSQYEVYACGSPAMTESAQSLLTQKCALPEDAFFCDAFHRHSDVYTGFICLNAAVKSKI